MGIIFCVQRYKKNTYDTRFVAKIITNYGQQAVFFLKDEKSRADFRQQSRKSTRQPPENIGNWQKKQGNQPKQTSKHNGNRANFS